MNITKIYNVAGFLFSINVETSNNDVVWNNFTNYSPFELDTSISSDYNDDRIFDLHIHDRMNMQDFNDMECLVEYENDVALIIVYRNIANGKLFINISQSQSMKNDGGVLMIDSEEHSVNLYLKIPSTEQNKTFIVNNSLMLLFAMFTARRNTLLMHASVVTCMDKAYMFLGKSGTGKSTHSRLWLQYVNGSDLLNDDNPVVRVFDDGSVRVFGSPWSGKTPCYKNSDAVLGSIVKLNQAPVNNIIRLKGVNAYISVLPSASGMKWDKWLTEGMHNTITEIAKRVPVYRLECLPDAEAALLCSNAIIL